jgi:hypothetical protein
MQAARWPQFASGGGNLREYEAQLKLLALEGGPIEISWIDAGQIVLAGRTDTAFRADL